MHPVWEQDNSLGAYLYLFLIVSPSCKASRWTRAPRATRGGKAHRHMGRVPEELFPNPPNRRGVAVRYTVIPRHDPPLQWMPWISAATGICLLALTVPTAQPLQPQRPQQRKPRDRRARWMCYHWTSFFRKTQSAWAGDIKRCYTQPLLKYRHCVPAKKEILPLPKPLDNISLQCHTEENVLCFTWTVNLLIFSSSALSNYCYFLHLRTFIHPLPYVCSVASFSLVSSCPVPFCHSRANPLQPWSSRDLKRLHERTFNLYLTLQLPVFSANLLPFT